MGFWRAHNARQVILFRRRGMEEDTPHCDSATKNYSHSSRAKRRLQRVTRIANSNTAPRAAKHEPYSRESPRSGSEHASYGRRHSDSKIYSTMAALATGLTTVNSPN